MDSIHRRPGTLLLRMGKVPFMDTTGESNLARVVKHMERSGGRILLSGIQAQPLEMLKRTGLIERIGSDHMFEHTGEAINYALLHLDVQKCRGCKHFAFRECAALSSAGTDPECNNLLKPGKQVNANSPI